jgi:hypothetical protein
MSGGNVGKDHAMHALAAVPGVAAPGRLTITEFNPDHAERGAGGIERFATSVAESLASSLASPGTEGCTRLLQRESGSRAVRAVDDALGSANLRVSPPLRVSLGG